MNQLYLRPAPDQRRFELGILLRSEAKPNYATSVLDAVLAGAAAGIAVGEVSVRYVQTLLFEVKGTAPSMLIAPALVLLAAALLAALPAVLRAARIDPSIMLRAD